MKICADSKKFLLKLARASIEEFLKTGKYLIVDESTVPSDVRFKSGCFVIP